MQFTTQLIIGLISATVLIGILITLYVKIFAKPSTPSSDGCQPGTTNGLGVGCSSCADASCASCTADGDCQNGGTCAKFGSGAKGVCVCPKPYFGLMCEKQCDTNDQCQNGQSCTNGTCTGGPKCKCTGQNQTCGPDGVTCQCLPGWAGSNCKQKLFTNFKVPTPANGDGCRASTHDPSVYDGYCKSLIHPTASYDNGLCYGDNGCTTYETIRCNIPKVYLNSDVVTTGDACSPDNNAAYANYIAAQPNFSGI
jgi:hypothetical protein